MHQYEKNFLSLDEVLAHIQNALATRRGFSLVRIGDGEAFTMGYEMIPNYQSSISTYDYAGVPKVNPKIRDLMLKSIKMANIVGLSDNREVPLCAPLIEKILEKHQIHLPLICNARINWDLHDQGKGPLYQIFKNQRVIVVGRVARQAAPIMKSLGLNVVATYNLDGISQLNQIYYLIQSKKHHFDVMLASTGIPAVPLCVKVARECRKIALDFGHAINDIVTPGFNVNHLPQATIEWRLNRYRNKIK